MDWREIKDDKEKYAAYLCSREWGVLKEAVRERAFGKCERCFLHQMDAVHHLSYARKYNESLSDLQAICNRCHEFTHGKSAEDPCTSSASADYYRHASGVSYAALVLTCPVCESQRMAYVQDDDGLSELQKRYPKSAVWCAGANCHNGHVFQIVTVNSGDRVMSWVESVRFDANSKWK